MRWLLALLAIGLAAYGGVCGWMYVQQRQLLYYPQFTRVDAGATDFSIVRDGITLRGWLIHPGRSRSAPILYFGGNGERIEHNREAFDRWFAGHGVYLLAYRGYGASDGSPGEVALSGDALALYDQVAAAHPGQPIRVIGRSLGSGIAAYVASQRPVEKLALVTPYDSMVDVAAAHYPWLPVRWLVRDRYDSVANLRGYRGDVLVLRAGRDMVVPAANTDRLIAALPQAPEVIDIAQAGHDDISGAPAYGDALARFMR